MADGPLDLNPDRVSQLLHAEAQGQIPEPWKPVLEKLRASGTLPPALPGGNQLWGGQLASGKATSAYKPEIPPPPTMSRLGSAAAEIPGALQGAKDTAIGAGRAIKDTVLDPEVLGMTAGGLVGTALGGPMGGIAGAATGGAAIAGGRELYNATQEHRPVSAGPAGSAAVTGAAMELGARGLSKLGGALRLPLDPAGKEAIDFYGKDMVGAHQMVKSAPLDVAANIATYGPGGKPIMEAAAQNRSSKLYGHLQQKAEELTPSQHLSGFTASQPGYLPDVPGKTLQDNLAAQLKTARATSGFDVFEKNYGDLRAIHPQTGDQVGPSVGKLLDRRSSLLAASRKAHADGEGALQAYYLDQAKKVSGRIEKILPDQPTRDAFNQMSSNYAKEMERLDNPAIYKLRRDTKADNVLHDILTNKLQTYTPLGKDVALSNEELVNGLQKAAGSDGWKQVQGDVMFDMVNRSVDPKTGRLSFGRMRDILNGSEGPTAREGGLSAPIRDKLFGPANKEINKALRLLELEEPRTETGRLFIAIRGPAAAMALGGGAVGALTGHMSTAVPGAGAILLAPTALAKALNSNVGRKLLVGVAQAATGAPQQKAAKALTTWVAQAAGEAGRETTSYAEPNRLPNPPGQ